MSENKSLMEEMTDHEFLEACGDNWAYQGLPDNLEGGARNVASEAIRRLRRAQAAVANLWHVATQEIPQVYEYSRRSHPLNEYAGRVWADLNWAERMKEANRLEYADKKAAS